MFFTSTSFIQVNRLLIKNLASICSPFCIVSIKEEYEREKYEEEREKYEEERQKERKNELFRDILFKYLPEEIELDRIEREDKKVQKRKNRLEIEIKNEMEQQRNLVKQDRRRTIVRTVRDNIQENHMNAEYFNKEFDKTFAKRFDESFAEEFDKYFTEEVPKIAEKYPGFKMFVKKFPPFAIFFAQLLANIVLEDDDIKFVFDDDLEEVKKHYIVRKIQNIYNVKILSSIYNYFISLDYKFTSKFNPKFNPKFNHNIKGTEGEKAFTYIKNRLQQRIRDLTLVYEYKDKYPEKIYQAAGGKYRKFKTRRKNLRLCK